MSGNLEPYSPLYIGRAAVRQTLQERYEEAKRQSHYWTHEYADHGDSEALEWLQVTNKMVADTYRALGAFDALAHRYPVQANTMSIHEL